MSLFDQLRPKWKHSDPAVRLEAVRGLEDQTALESIAACDPDEKVRVAAIHALTNQTAIGRIALSAESATVREFAVERVEDQALLLRIATSDPSATVRAHARSKCAGTHSARAHLRETLSKLQIVECRAEQTAEFCGTLDEVCQALSHDPRFFVNGDVGANDEAEGTARLRDTTRVAWAIAALQSDRVVARFVAQPRQSTSAAPAASGLTRFFHVKVWRIAENRFVLQAEEKRFRATHDALAWSRASSGDPDTRPAIDRDAPAG